MIHKAIEFAAKKHLGQVRKGSDTPYIAHPAEVMYYLTLAGADETTVVAGVLHDTVEDTDTTFDELEREFGAAVATLVRHETEDKTKRWTERKRESVAALSSAPFEALLICCADKLCNLKSIDEDMRLGRDVWAKFTGTPTETREYYRAIVNALGPLDGYVIYEWLVEYYNKVFGD